MIQKQTDTIIRVTTGRAESFEELMAAGWSEREICLRFSDDQQAFVWNARLKQAVQRAHTKGTDEKGRVTYGKLPDVLTPEMQATAKEFAAAHPLAYEKFVSESDTIGKAYLELADNSKTMKALAATTSDDERAKIARRFTKENGVEPTRENIARLIKAKADAARKALAEGAETL